MILAGDIGGTKTILALYEEHQDGWRCLNKNKFSSSDYAEFDDVLSEFLTEYSGMKMTGACIGVAGPVINGRCDTTNLPWRLDAAEMGRFLGTDAVWLLNDLEATAWGILALPDEDFVELNPNGKVVAGNKAILAAGTGLGEAIVAWDAEANKHVVIATEGGHTDFAPNSKIEIALLGFMLEKHPGHVSNERLISGEGLPNIYEFLCRQNTDIDSIDAKDILESNDPAAAISHAAVQQDHSLSKQVLSIFCRMYGAEAGNLALKCLPYGGVYLAGGIAAKILPFMQQSKFLEGFLAKGRYQAVLNEISVKVCLNQEAALTGALHYAISRLR